MIYLILKFQQNRKILYFFAIIIFNKEALISVFLLRKEKPSCSFFITLQSSFMEAVCET